MSIRKQSPPCRQSIQIGRLDLRMPTQATDPIIQIINGQKQNVLFFRFGTGVHYREGQKGNESKGVEKEFHAKGL